LQQVLLEFLPQCKAKLAELKEEPLAAPKDAHQGVTPSTKADVHKPDANRETATPTSTVNTNTIEKVESEKSSSTRSKRDLIDMRERIDHLQCLVDFTEANLANIIQLRAEIADGSLKSIAYDDLWHLFRPGETVLARAEDDDGGHAQICRVFFTTGGQLRKRRLTMYEEDQIDRDPEREPTVGMWTPFRIDCFSMDYNGTVLGPVKKSLVIKHYTGKKAITDLHVVPLRFHPNADNILTYFNENGRRFFASFGHKYYEGVTRPHKLREYDGYKFVSARKLGEDVASEVFIDFESYYRKNAWARPDVGRLRKSQPDPAETSEIDFGEDEDMLHHYDPEVDIKLAEDYVALNQTFLEPAPIGKSVPEDLFSLLPSCVPAYAFRNRGWCRFTSLVVPTIPSNGRLMFIDWLDLDILRPIDTARYSGFEDLVIPQEYKHLLAALVDNHTSELQKRREKQTRTKEDIPKPSSNFQVDLVSGKGQGLVILLHGPPGSGKTSTAETIAAYTRRPMYSLTCGDIGLEPDQVEKNLTEHTRLADKWGCVLLLDEADVFLVARTHKELKRNALVSSELYTMNRLLGPRADNISLQSS
jgi:flagellar biosynthesis GTPase FlhF